MSSRSSSLSSSRSRKRRRINSSSKSSSGDSFKRPAFPMKDIAGAFTSLLSRKNWAAQHPLAMVKDMLFEIQPRLKENLDDETNRALKDILKTKSEQKLIDSIEILHEKIIERVDELQSFINVFYDEVFSYHVRPNYLNPFIAKMEDKNLNDVLDKDQTRASATSLKRLLKVLKKSIREAKISNFFEDTINPREVLDECKAEFDKFYYVLSNLYAYYLFALEKLNDNF
jgi:hypothetical protein